MINRRRRQINKTNYFRRYTDSHEVAVTQQGGRVFAPLSSYAPTFLGVPIDTAPSSVEPSRSETGIPVSDSSSGSSASDSGSSE